uniref:DNA-directed RNA polymerase n=1 Tax=Meloidogyne hapla TaxID=6305 RepID=A0A1I8BWN8_MELHA
MKEIVLLRCMHNAVHGRIGAQKFVIPNENDVNSCKLADFDSSNIKNENPRISNTDKVDFGYMIADLIRNRLGGASKDGRLERIAKECVNVAYPTSSMTAIVKFLNGECDGFKRDRVILPGNTIWCE